MLLELKNKNQVYQYPEFLLMIVPAIVLILVRIMIPVAGLTSHSTNTYFSFSFGNISIFSWTLLIIPFILHLFLKQQNTGNTSFELFHILLSIALLIAVQFTYELNSASNVVENGSYWNLPFDRNWMEATADTFTVLTIQFLLQVIFCIYALIQLFPK